jgi:hypothetical protein
MSYGILSNLLGHVQELVRSPGTGLPRTMRPQKGSRLRTLSKHVGARDGQSFSTPTLLAREADHKRIAIARWSRARSLDGPMRASDRFARHRVEAPLSALGGENRLIELTFEQAKPRLLLWDTRRAREDLTTYRKG